VFDDDVHAHTDHLHVRVRVHVHLPISVRSALVFVAKNFPWAGGEAHSYLCYAWT
jgi:hypothetical protein